MKILVASLLLFITACTCVPSTQVVNNDIPFMANHSTTWKVVNIEDGKKLEVGSILFEPYGQFRMGQRGIISSGSWRAFPGNKLILATEYGIVEFIVKEYDENRIVLETIDTKEITHFIRVSQKPQLHPSVDPQHRGIDAPR